MWRFEIEREWSGEALGERFAIEVHEGGVRVEGPFFGEDMRPEAEGFCGRLWEHEVVEVFLAEDGGRYVEIELGPYGHWLVLAFDGYRQGGEVHGVVNSMNAERAGGRWRGELSLEPGWWSGVLARSVVGNAFAIHTRHGRRRYCAAFPPGDGSRPDFHRRDTYRGARGDRGERGDELVTNGARPHRGPR